MNTSANANGQEKAMVVADLVALAPALAMSATMDHAVPPEIRSPLPYLWHWLYFWPSTRQSALSADGHARKGDFLPDLGLPWRMWAGGRFQFHAPIEIGKSVSRTSRVTAVEEKTGRSGRLGFVTVTHEIACDGTIAVHEEQDIVYRDVASPESASPPRRLAPESSQWQREINPTEALLFRYSALTFNGHRIHYDKPYSREIEGYPNLVVHGPLIATLLMDLLTTNQPDAKVIEFSFRAIRPTFLGNPFHVCAQTAPDGKTIELWAKDYEGWLTMSARALLV